VDCNEASIHTSLATNRHVRHVHGRAGGRPALPPAIRARYTRPISHPCQCARPPKCCHAPLAARRRRWLIGSASPCGWVGAVRPYPCRLLLRSHGIYSTTSSPAKPSQAARLLCEPPASRGRRTRKNKSRRSSIQRARAVRPFRASKERGGPCTAFFRG
jgi:hypothetical protein